LLVSATALIPAERVENAILMLRGHKVLLDADLAALYGVQTRRLNEQVQRNLDRFPADFMFQLTAQDFANAKSQIATSNAGWGGKRARRSRRSRGGAKRTTKKAA
jgi:hypothetical protein